MKRISKLSILRLSQILLLAVLLIAAGCSLEKQSGFNRNMQNLTAHYNILFNARETLRQKQESYAASFIDDYNEILSVYPDTIAQGRSADKDLESAIARANTIINVKEQSHYIGDAYLILGKAYYLEANYFNAVEYFSLVINDYPKQKDIVQQALTWKARTLMYLNQLPQAKLVLDTALQSIDPQKKPPADVYATKLLYDVNAQDYTDGEEMAKKAVEHCKDKTQRLRWRFILAQLQELNQKPVDAVRNYAVIAKSNAVFEMAFNASLNRIRIEDSANGIKTNRIERLRQLLKEPNDKEFKDQIYYQIAQLQMQDKDIDGAIKNYNSSVRYSITNQSQKGLSYLRLAEVYFQNKADYLTSKKYYDSTLSALPVTYPGYLAIRKKGNNLALLAGYLQTIAREDTLQALAKMDEKTRNAVIDKMVNDRILQQQALAKSAAANSAAAGSAVSTGGPNIGGGGSSFYFYNSAALSQGLTDFKQKWGNRKLEDNWRRANRSGSDITNNTSASSQALDPDAPIGQSAKAKTSGTAGNYRQELLQGLPLTPAMVTLSNQRIYDAYVDIANFYRDILEDKKEAITGYEHVLQLYPNDPNKPAILYNLYRLYSDIDVAKADYYKNLLLKNYADTPFAKIITDPDYAKKLNDKDAEFTQAYNTVFDLYRHRQYKDVLQCVPDMMIQYPGNKFAAQLYYLQTIAAGHYEKVGPFTDSLKQIVSRFPNDKLVVPLINQHLTYIAANLAEMQARPVVLTNEDPLEIPFARPDLREQAAYQKPLQKPDVVVQTPVKKPEVIAPPVAKVTPPVVVPPVATPPVPQPVPAAQTLTATHDNVSITKTDSVVAIKQPEPVNYIFSKNDSTNYYFAVKVDSYTTNLSSSRFGIGQFDRANYAGKGIRHEIYDVPKTHQIIYVGRFTSLADVKKYAEGIVPLLPDIMKVPRDKYSYFIITLSNLTKITDKTTLDSYVSYYQKYYQP